jgi:GNAT superfamily N-acetyltransferase
LTPITITAASSEHLAAIPRIEIAVAAMFSEIDLPLEIRYLVTDSKVLIDAQQDGRVWMALDQTGAPVGFALADTLDGNAHLDEMDVLPDYGRQGIGTRLLLRFIDWARAANFDYATLVTFRDLPWNAPFYARSGFVAMQPDEIGDELHELLTGEARAGIDVQKRICMQFDLTRRHS